MGVRSWLRHFWALWPDKIRRYVHYCIREPIDWYLRICSHWLSSPTVFQHTGTFSAGVATKTKASCYQTTHSGQRIQRQVTSYRPILIRCTSYARTPAEILRTVYGGNESVPGGFFPQGANGNIAKRYLPSPYY